MSARVHLTFANLYEIIRFSAIDLGISAKLRCTRLQATLGEDGELEAIALMDGSLLKLLEFKHECDLSALFSLKLLKEFQYFQERELLALNWHILAAAIATGKEIAYYPYPLYVTRSSSSSVISPANLPKERYYLRQYLFQIEPSKWNQRQLNLLLTGVEQLLQQQQVPTQNNQHLPPQSQAWMITAQQLQEQLVQTQATLGNLQAWNQQLQTGKDWLESQWQAWMLKAQKAEVERERSRSLIQEMRGSKFWKLRKVWIELIQSRYREFFTSTPPQNISLNRQSLEPEQLKSKFAVENPLNHYNAGKRLLFFFSSLESGDADKFNLDLVTRLEQQGYEIIIVTTSHSEHPWLQSFYRITPDIFHLPNFLDPVHWLTFTRYIIASRQIDILVISDGDIAYYFLPLLRAEFPQVAFIDFIHNCDSDSHNGYLISCQFSQYLDCRVVSSQLLAKVDTDINSTTKSKLRVCDINTEMEAVFTEAIQARQTQIKPTEIDTELATVALLLALR